jgi:hypothetical protein
MNLPAVLQAGSLLQWAYTVYDGHAPDYDGLSYGGFNVIQTIYTDDLATDLNPVIDPYKDVVSIGFIAQNAAAPSEYILVIRGTVGILEWVQDAKFLPKQFPAVPGAGLTEDGGHSLGSALATLLALDVAVNSPFRQPTLITFASPRVGDLHFSSYFNSAVPDCERIANRQDLVPHLPLPPLYIHIGDETELNPGSAVANNLLCEHAMNTYMFLLDPANNPLGATCAPAAALAAPASIA